MSSKSLNKLYLFYPTSLIGFLICLVTRSPFSHAAVMFNGVLYDASESRGNFAASNIDPDTRKHICIEFSGDLRLWLRSMQGRKYDYRGVLLWVLGLGRGDRVYCFEAAWHALLEAGVAQGDQPKRLSGSDLLALVARGDGWEARQLLANAGRILRFFGGGDYERFVELLRGHNGHKVARAVLDLAFESTGTGHPIEACVSLAQSREVIMSFEEQLYARAEELEAIARGDGPGARDSPAPA